MDFSYLGGSSETGSRRSLLSENSGKVGLAPYGTFKSKQETEPWLMKSFLSEESRMEMSNLQFSDAA